MTVLSALTPAASVSLADQFYGLSGANSRVFTLDQIRADVFWCGTAGGSANALTLTPSIPIPAYAAGQVFRFIPSLANTSGTVTVAVSGLAAKSVNVGSLTLPTPAFATSDIVEIVFDGTGFQLISQVYSQGDAGAVVRTISQRLRDQISVADFGATGDGVTDDTAAIQAAIDAADAAGGGTVLLEGKVYAISAALTIASGVHLVGVGSGQVPEGPDVAGGNVFNENVTVIRALAGFPSTGMIRAVTPANDPYAIQNVRIEGILADANGIAPRCFDIRTVKNSAFVGLMAYLPTETGFYVHVNPIADTTSEGNNATQFNEFRNLSAFVAYNGNVTSAVGIYVDGSTVNNVNQNRWDNIYVWHGNGHGIDIVNSDTDLWTRVNTQAWGTGYGCALRGSDTNANEGVRDLTMIDCQFSGAFGTGGLLAASGTVVSSNWNTVIINHGNSSPEPVVEDGARISIYYEGVYREYSPTGTKEQFHKSAAYASGDTLHNKYIKGKINTGAEVDYLRSRSFMRGAAGTEYGDYRLYGYDTGVETELLSVSARLGWSFGGGTGIKKILAAVAALDFPSIAAQTSADLTMTVTGAATSDTVALGLPTSGVNTGLVCTAFVSAADTVTVRASNFTASAIDPGSLSFRVTVFNYT